MPMRATRSRPGLEASQKDATSAFKASTLPAGLLAATQLDATCAWSAITSAEFTPRQFMALVAARLEALAGRLDALPGETLLEGRLA